MSKPIVAVVGRPNVGKSTLFNDLAGQQISIVKDTPGVTRDRIYAEVTWLDKSFTLIDTGGIEPDTSDVILAQMREQAEIAIETADVIIFLTDVKQGLVDSDAKVADMLRRSRKPVILAVNKVDNFDKLMPDVYEFYTLGIGDPHPISAASKLGLGDMLDEVIKHFPQESETEEEDERPKVAIIGKPNVGKSSIINKLLGKNRVIVSNIAGTTRDVLEEQINLSGITLNLIDTAGIRKTDDYVENIGVNKAKKYASEADLIIFVIDASRPLDNNDYEIMDLIMNKKVLVLLNKSDIQAVVTKEDILKHLSCNVISVSAKEETGIDDLENEIKNMFFNGEIETNEEIYITNLRHKNLLREALESLKLVKGGIEAGVSEDFLTIDMMNAYEKLGLIIGEEVEDDLADRIFEKFCMGK
mgnify:CR=1 FL=1